MDWVWIILACVPGIALAIALGRWIARERAKEGYFIRAMKPDAWGTRFEIVAPNGEIVAQFLWFTVAKQQCAHLNNGLGLQRD